MSPRTWARVELFSSSDRFRGKRLRRLHTVPGCKRFPSGLRHGVSGRQWPAGLRRHARSCSVSRRAAALPPWSNTLCFDHRDVAATSRKGYWGGLRLPPPKHFNEVDATVRDSSHTSPADSSHTSPAGDRQRHGQVNNLEVHHAVATLPQEASGFTNH
jgi:hypothetical protein